MNDTAVLDASDNPQDRARAHGDDHGEYDPMPDRKGFHHRHLRPRAGFARFARAVTLSANVAEEFIVVWSLRR
jgi:hypothetical protein